MRPVVVPVTRISPLIHPVRHALRWAVSALAIGYISIATFPGGYFPVQAGLDLSWVYAINWLAETPHRFGREVNFTYGPLGFLFLPTNFGEHVLWSALFRLFSAIAFAAALALLRPIA